MNDRKTVSQVIWLIGSIAILLTLYTAVATLSHTAVPDQVWTLLGTTVGALTAILVSTHTVDATPTTTNTINSIATPVVPTTEEPSPASESDVPLIPMGQ